MDMKAIRKLPELQENQEWACDGGCDVIRPKHFENIYSETIAHDASTIKRLSEFYWTCQNNHLLCVWCKVKSDYALLSEENYIEEKLNIVESNSIQESIDLLDQEIESIKNSFIEESFLTNEDAETLEQLITKAMQIGEFYAKRDSKTQAVPEGFVLVPKSEIGHYYYDESEGMYIDEPDHFLTDLDIGEAQEVKCRDYFDLPSKYAAKAWDENNQDVGNWEFFNTEAEANNVAAHCKAMIEAQEQSQ